MSLLRCLYGRTKLVKSVCGDFYLNISFSGSQSSTKQYFLISLNEHHFNSNGMTFSEKHICSKTTSSQNESPGLSSPIISCSLEKTELNLHENGLKVQKKLVINSKKNPFISEGYYESCWNQAKQNNSQNDDGKENKDQAKCEFNFNSINVRLLETFGFIGTAVAVGIDVRSRINEWTPYNRRGIHDFCHYHHHHFNKNAISTRIFDGFNKPFQQACHQNDPCLTTIRYCGSCKLCKYLFDRIFHLYFTAFPSPSSSPILNIVSKESSSVPLSDNTEIKTSNYSHIFEDDDLTLKNCLSQLPHLDRKQSPSIVSKEDESKSCQKTDRLINDGQSVNKSKQPIKQSSLCDNEHKKLKSSDDHVDVGSPKVSESTQSKKAKEDPNDIAAVFRIASIEYTNQLNNLVAISLMVGHRPAEAMQCWSSCESSSRAFFNMGVAYESGRYAKNAQPDLDRAHDCYALAASMGHRDAIYNLALFYLYGKGKIEPNFDRAVELLQIASSKGVEAAQKYCFELNKYKREQEIQEIFQTQDSKQANDRPLRHSYIRSSASMFGPCSPKLTPKQISTSEGQSVAKGALKRINSAPNLLDLNNMNRTTMQVAL